MDNTSDPIEIIGLGEPLIVDLSLGVSQTEPGRR
jgi:hypothetical protein